MSLDNEDSQWIESPFQEDVRYLDVRLTGLESGSNSETLSDFERAFVRCSRDAYRQGETLESLKPIFLRMMRLNLAVRERLIGMFLSESYLVIFKEEVRSLLPELATSLTHSLCATDHPAASRNISFTLKSLRDAFPEEELPSACKEHLHVWAEATKSAVGTAEWVYKGVIFYQALVYIQEALGVDLNLPVLDQEQKLSWLDHLLDDRLLSDPFLFEFLLKNNPELSTKEVGEHIKQRILESDIRYWSLQDYPTLKSFYLLLSKFPCLKEDGNLKAHVLPTLKISVDSGNGMLPVAEEEERKRLTFEVARALGAGADFLRQCHPYLACVGTRRILGEAESIPVETDIEKTLWGNCLKHSGVSPSKEAGLPAKAHYESYVDQLKGLFAQRPILELLGEVSLLFYHPSAYTYAKDARTVLESFDPKGRHGNCEGRVLGMGMLLDRLLKDHPDFEDLEIQIYVKHVRLIVTVKGQKYLVEGGLPTPWIQEKGTGLISFYEAIQLKDRKGWEGSTLAETINEEAGASNSHLFGRIPPATRHYPASLLNLELGTRAAPVLAGRTYTVQRIIMGVAAAAWMAIGAEQVLDRLDQPISEDRQEVVDFDSGFSPVGPLAATGAVSLAVAAALSRRRKTPEKLAASKEREASPAEGKEASDRSALLEAWRRGPELLAASLGAVSSLSLPLPIKEGISPLTEASHSIQPAKNFFDSDLKVVAVALSIFGAGAAGLWYLDANRPEDPPVQQPKRMEVFLVPSSE